MSELSRLAEDAIRTAKVPGVAVAVVDGDRVVGAAAAGSADLATGAPMTVDGAANWFSTTKIATATAAMILAEGGSLDLDTPVTTYLGDRWPAAFSQVRVRHLLSHSSGLRNPVPIRWVHRPGDPRPDPAAFLARLLARQRRPRFQPGVRAAYSNVGYLALGEVIAAAAGLPYETFVREQLLTPLGMTHTAFSWNDPALTGVPRVTAHQRIWSPLTPLLAVLPHGIAGPRAGGFVTLEAFELDSAAYGGLIGPVSDAARLVALYANRGSADGTRLLRPDSVDAMTAIRTRGRPYDLGLGWFRPHQDGFLGVEHLGGGMGYWNLLRLHPHNGRGAAVWSNTTDRWNITAFADAAIDLVAGTPGATGKGRSLSDELTPPRTPTSE